ncbi:AAA family ATPase [Actomonas aquatica]|uniref:Cytidylate kinase family protein n=1 Tax=Actomonas aquatica TaxID=2866162 RepID=A0ABZ1C5Y8_9BACT|nr:cytidylate kinase family protein [Opitutus sp. WL0086]WRQ87055.1 cytidylate kinase family protein [Opitutus sp. WL0086]
MTPTPKLETAQSYLNLHLTRTGRCLPVEPQEPFITLSREAGAGASSLARLIANQLNTTLQPGQTLWRVFDGNLVEAMLRDLNYPEHLARYLPEDSISEIDASIGELVGLHPNLWELVQHTNCLIRHLAGQGRCILIGRGANFATAALPHGLHLRLIGNVTDRASHMAGLCHTTVTKAADRNARSDAARRRYARTHFDCDIDDPQAYDLVLNTSSMPLPEIASAVVHLVHARTPVAAA